MKETNHDYQGCLVGNFYDTKCSGEFSSWEEFKSTHFGFDGSENGFDDRYHFVFRYDIYKDDDNNYILELCIMLQRKGIYSHLYINNITKDQMNKEVKEWLKGRKKYMLDLWKEV